MLLYLDIYDKIYGTLNIYDGQGSNLLNITNMASNYFDFALIGNDLVLTGTSSAADKIVFNNWKDSYNNLELKFTDDSYNYDKIAAQKLGLNEW